MNILRPVFLILFCIFIIIEIPAETAGKSDSSILFDCAYSNDIQLQLMALNSLKANISKEEKIDAEKVQILVDLSHELILIDSDGNDVNTINNPEVRIKAIGILGELGGQQALNTLSNIIRTSNDSLILLEAVKSSKYVIADDYRYFINALAPVMKKQHSLFKDNGFAYAALSAIDSITLNAGNILTSEILGLMMIYSEGEYTKEVKDYSRKLLNLILTER